MSLLVTVLVIQVLIYLVNTIGADTINQVLWLVYTKLPTKQSKIAKEQLTLRTEILRLKREMKTTSSQDEFAKWAKLRRQHDKTMVAYDEKANTMKSFKASFDTFASAVRFLMTTGLRFFLQFWFAKSPIFQLPKAWAPPAVEWVLSFPRAPMGTISIQVWGTACSVVIAILGDAVGSLIGQTMRKDGKEYQKTRMPVGTPKEEKKEL